MKSIVEKINVYRFEELSGEAKQSAVENLHDINVDHEWWDYIFEDIKERGKIIGIDIDNIYFSGFSSQGDGACFEGDYAYKKGSVKEIKSSAPNDKELHRIAEALFNTQKTCFFGMTASVKHSGHYYHYNCTEIDLYDRYDESVYDEYGKSGEIEESLKDFMRWMYKRLENEYRYLVSEEAIIDTILVNEYEFTEDGELY